MGGRYQDRGNSSQRDFRCSHKVAFGNTNVVDILRVCVVAVNIFSVTKQTMFRSVVFAVAQVF